MNRQRPTLIALCLFLLCSFLLAGDKKNDSGQVSTLTIAVVKEDNGKPVRNAAVVLHPVQHNGKQSRGGLELKTDSDGKASMDGIPYGVLRVQVIATGFQTFGQDYTVSEAQQLLTVKLKRPQGQYSIYESHPDATTGAPTLDKQQ